MSILLINTVVEEYVYQAQMNMLLKLKKHLQEETVIPADDLDQVIKDFTDKNVIKPVASGAKASKAAVAAASGVPKKKRVPGPHNIFLGKVMTKYRCNMKEAQAQWAQWKLTNSKITDKKQLLDLWIEENAADSDGKKSIKSEKVDSDSDTETEKKEQEPVKPLPKKVDSDKSESSSSSSSDSEDESSKNNKKKPVAKKNDKK